VSQPYHYVMFRWLKPLDLDGAAAELCATYEVAKKLSPRGDVELSLYKEQRDVVTVKADTLSATLGLYRAVLFQKERKSFTTRDTALQAWVLKNFDKSTPTPFPLGGDSELKHEAEKTGKTTNPTL
jgi:hypothetical protein